MATSLLTGAYGVTVEVGGLAVETRTTDADFRGMLERRYAGFLSEAREGAIELEVDLVAPGQISSEEDVRVTREGGQWKIRRGDFDAEFDPGSASGRLRCSANPFAMDALLRIVQTLGLARTGGFLVHAASAIRNGRGLLFAGESGAGKTTMCALAPDEATLLSDEVSCVRRTGEGYRLFGTPFCGELARSGTNTSAPLAAAYVLAHARENRVVELSRAEAVRALLRNILFFAEDAGLVEKVFYAACEFVARVPVLRLEFAPRADVWEMLV